jgi:flagellar assembly factor FliW
MPVTIESSRFGALQFEDEVVIEFPQGLIGLEGTRYALIDRNPNSGFLWLHCIDDPTLALPVVDPRLFFPSFTLELGADDRELIGIEDPAAAALFVTVRARPRPEDITVNLRAPLVVWEGHGYQVLNAAPDAELQAPLFALVGETAQPVVDAA